MTCIQDTDTVDLTITGGQIYADVRINPDPTNALTVGDAGLFVSAQNATGWFSVTSQEHWVYAGADAPTFWVATPGDFSGVYSPGTRIRLKQGGGYLYFIVTAAAYDAGSMLTTLTLYGGTSYVLNSAAITDMAFSIQKVPTGFPLNPTLWTQESTYNADTSQVNPTDDTWYNLGGFSLTIPVGMWYVDYRARVYMSRTSGDSGQADNIVTLSTAPNSDSDTAYLYFKRTGKLNANTDLASTATARKTQVLAAKTTYYLNILQSEGNIGPNGTIQLLGSVQLAHIRALCAYL